MSAAISYLTASNWDHTIWDHLREIQVMLGKSPFPSIGEFQGIVFHHHLGDA